MSRARLRDLGINIGHLPTGTHNAITDIPGVEVGHCTVIYDEPRIARTGVTVIMPRSQNGVWDNNAFAAYYSFNGNGEMTGLAWLDEAGLLFSNIGITNTHQVGMVRDTFIAHAIESGSTGKWWMPVVTETYDGFLSDINAFHLKPEHVYEAIRNAKGGRVEEGNVGGGTGMICHGFKGGIGTSSRIVEAQKQTYTVGVLVQANYGARRLLRVDGVPVGKHIPPNHTPLPGTPEEGSIIIIVGTDAPLLPIHCKRLAQRATVGLGRVGSVGAHTSGDIFLAFATGNDLPAYTETPIPLKMLPHEEMTIFFEAVAEATEEAILNALTAAETMTGYQGRVAHALPLDELQRIMAQYQG